MQLSYGTKEEATKNEHTTDHYPGGADIHGSIVYGEKNIIIKKHPRDGRNYEKEFPQALHFNKNIPMQMLAVMGVSFECVVTVNSSSALSFGAEANIDWWGEQMDEELICDEGFLTLKEAKQVLLH